MKNQRHVAYGCLYLLQYIEAQARPVLRIFAVDIADTGCQEVNSQISDGLALLRISALA